MWSELLLKVKQKCFLFLLIVPIIFTACQPAQVTTVPTPTAIVNCKTSWEQERVDDNQNLTFVLELEKYRFVDDRLNKREELILSTFTLKNAGSVPIWVNKGMRLNSELPENHGEIYFVLISPWGETAILMAYIDANEPKAKNFTLLNPNETIVTESGGIMSYAFLSLLKQNSKITFPKGKYCVWAVYHNQTNPGLDGPVWTGKIKSNLVEFEVVK
jgi:hypothetical protein